MLYENSVAPRVFTVLWLCSQGFNLFLGPRIATLDLKTREKEIEKQNISSLKERLQPLLRCWELSVRRYQVI